MTGARPEPTAPEELPASAPPAGAAGAPEGERCIQFVASHDDGREWRSACHDSAEVLAAVRQHLDRPGMYSICIWFSGSTTGNP